MYCPKCKEHILCGCNACKSRLDPKYHYKCDIMVGDLSTCPHCGLTMHVDGWLDAEWQQVEEEEMRAFRHQFE